MDDETPDEAGTGPESASLIDYRGIIQRALRDVPRDVLTLAAEEGLPGAHHFLIDFQTDHPGVEMPARLFKQFPASMRIVLQHQFWNLEVMDDAFEVDLRFGGEYARLHVPFDAMTAFIDPVAEIAFAFDPDAAEALAAAEDTSADEATAADAPPVADRGEAGDSGGAVVSLDAFRKRDR